MLSRSARKKRVRLPRTYNKITCLTSWDHFNRRGCCGGRTDSHNLPLARIHPVASQIEPRHVEATRDLAVREPFAVALPKAPPVIIPYNRSSHHEALLKHPSEALESADMQIDIDVDE